MLFHSHLRIVALLAATCAPGAAAQSMPAPNSNPASNSLVNTDPLAEPRALIGEGRVAEAASRLRSYVADHPSSADAHFLLGYALFKDHQPTQSLAEYTAGAKYRRPHAEEFQVIASDYVLLNDFSDADKWFTEVTTEKPDDPEAWYLLGRTRFNENIYAGAISAFDKAIALRPKFVEAENNEGLCWKELNNPAKAREAFETAIAWQGETPKDAQPFLNLGILLAATADNEHALPYLTRATSLAPNNPSVHEERGKALMALQQLPEAQAELETAIALSPETSSLHFKLAQILRKEGQTERSQREFDLTSKLNSTHSSTQTPNPPPTATTPR